jgi:hypothetical protein
MPALGEAKSISEAMIANWQHADLVATFMDAWNATICTGIATYDDNCQGSFRTDLAKDITELGSNPADYELADKPTDDEASVPRPK